MASRTEKNILTLLAMIDAQVMWIRRVYEHRSGNKTVMSLTDRATAEIMHVRALWPNRIAQKEADQIKAKLKQYLNQYLPVGSEFSIITSTVMVLDMLDWLWRHVRQNPQKARAVVDCIVKIKQIHRHFDRRLDKFELYDDAKRRCEAFYETQMQ